MDWIAAATPLARDCSPTLLGATAVQENPYAENYILESSLFTLTERMRHTCHEQLTVRMNINIQLNCLGGSDLVDIGKQNLIFSCIATGKT